MSDASAEVFQRFQVPSQPAFVVVSPNGDVELSLRAATPGHIDELLNEALATT